MPEILTILLLHTRDVDDPGFDILGFRVNRRGVQHRIDLIHLPFEPFVEASERMVLADFHIDTALVLGGCRCLCLHGRLRRCRRLFWLRCWCADDNLRKRYPVFGVSRHHAD